MNRAGGKPDPAPIQGPVGRFIFWLTTGILGAWVMWALVDVSTDARFPSFRSFGLISPLVGFLCLLVSLAALREASRRRAATWQALGASVLSIVIGVVPFFALPFDPS